MQACACTFGGKSLTIGRLPGRELLHALYETTLHVHKERNIEAIELDGPPIGGPR